MPRLIGLEADDDADDAAMATMPVVAGERPAPRE